MTTCQKLRLGFLLIVSCALVGSSVMLAFPDERDTHEAFARADVQHSERIESANRRIDALEQQGLRDTAEAKVILASQAEMRRQVDEMQWLLRLVVVGLGGLLAEAAARLINRRQPGREVED